MPGFIQFDRDSLIVLQKSLLASTPEEGCALLIGDQKISSSLVQKNCWKVRLIWPCCNIWEPGMVNLFNSKRSLENSEHKKLSSRKNRFAIDPREQILAQRWAREHNLKVLGAAHSHPDGTSFPSYIDRSWHFSSGIMVIVDGSRSVRSWLLAKDSQNEPLELIYLENP